MQIFLEIKRFRDSLRYKTAVMINSAAPTKNHTLPVPRGQSAKRSRAGDAMITASEKKVCRNCTSCAMKGCERVTAPMMRTTAAWKRMTMPQARVASRLSARTAPWERDLPSPGGMSESPYLTTTTPMKRIPMAVVRFRNRANPLLPGSSESRSPEVLSREIRFSRLRMSSRFR